MRLYSFWRSIASFRVRIAFNLKGIKPDETVDINLIKGDQRADAFRAVNPQMLIPALTDGDSPLLFQSLAIMEYLDETRPDPPIMPKDASGRARVRALSLIAIADAHPMSVPRMRNYLTNDAGFSQEQMLTFVRHWQTQAFAAYEGHLSRDPETGRFCHGDTITMADICLAAHTVGASFFDVSAAPYPTVKRIADTCLVNDAFARAHPLRQPGAPEKIGN